MYPLSTLVRRDGERVPMLLDGSGLPLFFPTLYATAKLRNSGAAVNTIKNKLTDILILLRWEASLGRDLIAEFSRGEFLTQPDVMALRDFASLDMREIGTAPAYLRKASGSPSEARIAHITPAPTVSTSQHYNRLSTIADYLGFVASTVTQHRDSTEDAARIEKMTKIILSHRPRGRRRFTESASRMKSPTPELVDRFMDVARIDHPDNPFRSPGVRLRNAILFGLLRCSGMRRGELLSLKVDQFAFGEEPLVWVRRNQDDPTDPRPDQPASKTKERPLPLPHDLAEQIHDYILSHRATVAPARKHGYLLVSHQRGKTYGRPLSLSAVSNQIVPAMRAVHPDFKAIHPHAFRHHFNYELSVGVDRRNERARSGELGQAPISEARELDLRAQLNGHANRRSGDAYNERHRREVSDRAARQVQAGIAGKKPLNRDADG